MPGYFLGDPLHLQQVLTHLIDNSIKYTETGEIIITIRLIEEIENKVRIKFSVSDSGIGMDESQLARLFRSFTQLEESSTRKRGGLGLGLVISKQLVEMMGGEISVESNIGEGSTFHVSLMLELSAKNHEKQIELLPSKLQGMHVLVVDDNSTSRKILSLYMEDIGCIVTGVTSGMEAIETLKSNTGGDPVKLILMDWRMQNMNGIEAGKRILEDKDLPFTPIIIMVSAYDREELIQQAADSSLDAYLVKPVSRELLCATITRAFNKREEYEKEEALKQHENSNIQLMRSIGNAYQDNAELMSLLKNFDTQLANNDGEATSSFAKIKQLLNEDSHRNYFDALEKHITNYDYDEAREKLKDLITRIGISLD
ncbi:MAG: response regulator [Gammaproteobacteria bacterium]|nr:response regulator [Gammaproteobacteria bacterium]